MATQEYIDDLILVIETAEDAESVTNQMMAAVLDFLNVNLKKVSQNEKIQEEEAARIAADAVLQKAIDAVSLHIDRLVGNNASQAIDNFNEILEFLNGLKDSDSLTALLADIDARIGSRTGSVEGDNSVWGELKKLGSIVTDLGIVSDISDDFADIFQPGYYIYQNGDNEYGVGEAVKGILIVSNVSYPGEIGKTQVKIELGKTYERSFDVDERVWDKWEEIYITYRDLLEITGTKVTSESGDGSIWGELKRVGNLLSDQESEMRKFSTVRFDRIENSLLHIEGITGSMGGEVVFASQNKRFCYLYDDKAYENWPGCGDYFDTKGKTYRDKIYLCDDKAYVFFNGDLRQLASGGTGGGKGDKGDKGDSLELNILGCYQTLDELKKEYPSGPDEGENGFFMVGDTLYLWSGGGYEPLNLDVYRTFSLEQFVEVSPAGNDINIDFNKTPYAKVTLSGDGRIFNLSVSNVKDGASGKILVFQTGFKQISVGGNIKGTIDLPLNSNTVALLTYNVLGDTVYMHSNVVLGDVQYPTPQRITDLTMTYYDNSVCALMWTAPYANNIYDSATEYDMRYANSEVDADDPSVWNGMRQVMQVPLPSSPGDLQRMTVTGLDAGKEYYIYIKAVKLNYGVKYTSPASDPVYCKTKGGMSDEDGYYRIDLRPDMLYPSKRGVKMSDGVSCTLEGAVDEQEKDVYLEDGYPDTSNRVYETGWEPRISGIDNPYELTIDLHSRHVLDKLYLYCRTKNLFRLFISTDIGFEREYITTPEVVYNGFSVMDLRGKTARFIHLQFDNDVFSIQESVADGEEVYPTLNQLNSVAGIHCLRLYGRQASDKPAYILPPARLAVQERTMDEFFCTNGHFYQQGRIHSKCSGSHVRLYGAFGHFGPSPSYTDYTRIADYCVRPDRIPWVFGNNGMEVYLKETLEKTYAPYGLSPVITGTDIIDYCRWPGYTAGKKQNKQIDNYWLPDKWIPLPSKGVRGYEKYLAETTNPENYKTLAKTCHHLSAIYGNTAVSPEVLDLYPADESTDSGLHLLSGLEFDNEPDKTWEGWMGYMQPEELAAQLSAVYDGHNGILSDEDGNVSKYGIRGFNNDFLVVMPGMSGINTGYIRAVYEWCKAHRPDGKFPVDVLNFHSYFSNIGNQAGDNTIPVQYAITFEEALKGEASEFYRIADFRNRYLSDKEIWITEFGYGEAGGRNTQSKYQCYTQPGRQIGSFTVPDRHRSDVKGAWTLRAVLGMLEVGVSLVNYYSTEMEGSYFGAGNWDSGAGYEMFHWNDCKDLTPGAKAEAIRKYEHGYARGGFSVTGLFGPLLGCGGFPISRAYWWIATFRTRLAGYVYTGRKYLEDERISVACFRKKNEEKGAYVVWMNTDENNGIGNAEIPLPDNITSFVKVETWIPELTSPEQLPADIEYDQPRTQLPTSRYEKYTGGQWVIQNKKPDGKVYESFTQLPADYPENPQEGDTVTVIPSRDENPYFPIVGPVGGKHSVHGNNPGANQYEHIDSNDPVKEDGTPKWSVAGNNYLAWRQVHAVCDYIDYTEDGQHGIRGDETHMEALRGNIVDNVTEFPVYYFFDAVPDPDFRSEVTDLIGIPVNSSSVKLYWNNHNPKDTGYEIFMSDMPESGYTLFKEVAAGLENSVQIAGLDEDTTYYFKVRARCGTKSGELSDYTSVKTFSELPAPENLHVSGRTASSISLCWDYTSGQVADFVHYAVYRADSSGAFVLVGKVEDRTVLTYMDAGLAIGTSYKYRVRAVGLNGQSVYSAEVDTRTLLAEECSPVLQRAVTDKFGSRIVLTFDLPIGIIDGDAKDRFTLSEDGNRRLVNYVSRDESDTKRLFLSISQDSLKDYDRGSDIRLDYDGGSILSEYGVALDGFTGVKVINVIGNYTNIEATYELNFCSAEAPLPESDEWNNIVGNPESDAISVNLTDIYGRPSDIYVSAIQEKPKYTWSSPDDSGYCEIDGIEAAVYKYVWRGPSYRSDITEKMVARLRLSGLDNEHRYTISHFGARSYGAETLVKMKVNDTYAGPLEQYGNKTSFLTIEDCKPVDGILDIDIINAADEGDTSKGYPLTAFMIIEEFRSGSEPENKNVWLRDAGIVGDDGDGIVKFQDLTVHLNCIGTVTAYRISECEDMTGASWSDIVDGIMDVPYRLSDGYGEKTLYVQVKNSYSESNVRRIDIEFKDPYVPLVLRNAYINNDDASTYSPEVFVMADKEGIPTHYRIGEDADLSLQEWMAWPDPKTSVVPFTLSAGGGQKTVYLQLKDNITESAIKVDMINYVVLDYEEVTLDLALPQGTDTDGISLSFAPLKYNKEFAYGVTSDDTHLTAWSILFKYFNGMWIDDAMYFHKYAADGTLNKRTTGSYAPRALTYTDGFGTKRRFAVNTANDVCPPKLVRPDNAGGPQYPYLLWPEIEEMLEFDGGFSLHDVWDPAMSDYGGTVENIVNGINFYNDYLKNRFGRKAMVMTEPNGDAKYTTAAQLVPDIRMITRQHNTGLGYVFVSLKDESLNTDKLKVARMFNESPANGLDTYKQDFLKDFPGNGMYGEFGCHGVDRNKDSDKKIWPAVSGFFDWLCDTYGEPGNDTIWFATNEEVIQYKALCRMSAIGHTVSDGVLHITLKVPVLENFNWRELTLLVDGIGSGTVTESDNVRGLTYGLKGGHFMINVNLDTTLEERAEKYTAAFEKSFDNEDKDAAEYFIQRLKPSLQTAYTDRLAEVTRPPVLVSFSLEKDITEYRNVFFDFEALNYTFYMISENPDFTDAEWDGNVYHMFTISDTEGLHTVYFKVKNRFGESEVMSDTVSYEPPAFALRSISINGGAAVANSREVSVSFQVDGLDRPTHYMLSEDPDFADTEWSGYLSSAPFVLTSGDGMKTVYAKVKTETEESAVISATIELKIVERKVVMSVWWLTGTDNSEQVNVGDTVVNRVKPIRNYEIPLLYADGTKSGIRFYDTASIDGSTGLQTEYENPTEPDVYTGVYTYELVKTCSYYSVYNQPETIVPHRIIFKAPAGTYRVRILGSTKNANGANTDNKYYECNGVQAQPTFSLVNNFTDFVELDNVVPDDSGYLIVKWWGNPTRSAMTCVNLIEIIKKEE